MAKDRRSRDQKRRDKLAERNRRSQKAESLVYMGRKYQTEELIPTFLATEIGIYETYVITDRKLVDATVVAAVEKLIRQLRTGTFPPLTDTGTIDYRVGHEEDLIIQNIRRGWKNHFETEWQPPRDKLIGVLRTTLGSIEKMRTPGPRSQSYLHHIAGFLTKKVGVSVRMQTEDREPVPEPAEDELVQLGRRWILEGNRDARAEFYELADYLIKHGQVERVINGSHLLIGEECDPSSIAMVELTELVCRAHRSLISGMG